MSVCARITVLLLLLWLLAVLVGRHRHLALENFALRHELAVYGRTVRRPSLRTTDRFFSVRLAGAWTNWKHALLIVSRDTVDGVSAPAASANIRDGASSARSASGIGQRLQVSGIGARDFGQERMIRPPLHTLRLVSFSERP